MKRILLPFLLLFIYTHLSAQVGAGPATDCTSSIPEICPGGSYPASITGTATAPGASFACPGTSPIVGQPAFFFIEVGASGNIDLVMDPVDPFTGLPVQNDLDFIAWGPFSSTANMCTQLQAVNRIDCSYSSAYSETCNITGANPGDIYVIEVSNWHSNGNPQPCNIQFSADTTFGGIANPWSSGGFAGANATINPCSTDPVFNLIDALNGFPDDWGTWIDASNNPVSPTFDPATDPGGVYRYIIGGTTNCPGDTSWLTINLISASNVFITSSATACSEDDPFTLTASPSGGIFSGNGVSGNIFTPDISLIGSNTISYSYSANGCSVTVTQNLTVNPSPTVLAANEITTNPSCYGDCDGTAIIIASSGTSPYTYDWFGEDPLALCSGTFNYNVIDLNGCIFSNNVTLYDPVNTIGVLNSYNSNCFGDNNGAISITMNGGVTPPGTISDPNLGYCLSGTATDFIDQNGGGPLQSAIIEEVVLIGNSNNINNNTAGVMDYYEDYTNNGMHADITEGQSYTVDLILGDLSGGAYPTGAKVFIDYNIDGDFDDTGEEVGMLNCTWVAPLIGSINFTVPTTLAYGPTRMRVVSQDAYATSTSTIGPCDYADPTITNDDPWFGATEDYSIVLSAPTISATFLWNNAQTLDSIYNLSPGTYIVTITPSDGCAVQDSATITESEDISFNPTITNVSCNSFTDGTVILAPSGGMDNNYTPNWYGYDPLALDNGTYNLTVTDNFGCSNDTTITISEPSYFSVDFTTSDNEICLNDFVTLNFDFNTGGIPPFSIDYTINGNAQTPIPFNTNGLLLEPTSPGLGNNTYSIITITDGTGCEIQNTILPEDIFVNPIPDIGIAISGTNPICFGDSSSIFFTNINGTPDFNVAYNINGIFATENVLASGNNLIVSPGITTTYTLDSVVDAKGCSSLLNDNATLIVNELPELTWSVPSEVCDEDIVQMNFSFSAGVPPWNIFYDVNGSSYSIPLSNTVDSIAISPSSNSTYTLVSVIDNNGCKKDFNEVLTISIFPLPSGEITGGGSICNDGSTADVIIDAYNGTPPYSIIYAYGVNTQLISNVALSYVIPSNQSGIYSLIDITDSKGCVSKDLSGNAIININPLPEANITAYPQPADILNPLIHFNDISSGHIHGIWDFGDGNANTTNFGELTHIYTDTGRYQVSLTIESDSGCYDIAYQTIIISPIFTVYIPNSFTPNNDLVNDYFLPIIDGVNEYEFNIYNRSGERIFSTDNTNKAWDGKIGNSNDKAAQGVYIYSLIITDINGKLRTYEGSVTLIR